MRKEYDYWGVPIGTWNKSNVVAFVDCPCGKIAKKRKFRPNEFYCIYCGKTFEKKSGKYVEKEIPV